MIYLYKHFEIEDPAEKLEAIKEAMLKLVHEPGATQPGFFV